MNHASSDHRSALTSEPGHLPFPPPQPLSAVRYGLVLSVLVPVAANVCGSLFNVWYNHGHIEPFLTASQSQRFGLTVTLYNGLVYPAAAIAIGLMVRSLAKAADQLRRGAACDPVELATARRRLINLPWGLAVITAAGWLTCVPVFLIALATCKEPIDPQILLHLPVSFLLGGFIAATHGLFVLDLILHRCLFPVFFADARPADVKRAVPLTLSMRAWMFVIAAVVGPVLTLTMLFLAPRPGEHDARFVFAVAAVAICFGLVTTLLMSEWIATPIQLLRRAAGRIAAGDLDVRVDLVRADDFGPLIDDFNNMVVGLREKQRIRQSFGLHVGEEAAEQILKNVPGLHGHLQDVTVMFVDLRGFTQRSESADPVEIVELLNGFFGTMTPIIHEHGGLVNKFLGDGFMALFGVASADAPHADQAVKAALQMISAIDEFNASIDSQGCEPLELGIGIHSGPAILGSIGCDDRLEYTAIGDVVNLASRVESLCGSLGQQLLYTTATRRRLSFLTLDAAMPPQRVKGKSRPVTVYSPFQPSVGQRLSNSGYETIQPENGSHV